MAIVPHMNFIAFWLVHQN